MKTKYYYIKAIIAVILGIGTLLPLTAQQDQEITTLFGNKEGGIDNGGWGGLTFGYTKIKDKDTYLMGARGGWLIDHHFTIGLAGHGFVSDKEYYELDAENPNKGFNLAGGYGGLFLEAIIAPNSPVHVTIPVIIGAGGVSYIENTSWNDYDNNYEPYILDSDAFFVFEPGLEVELNLVRFMRLSLGGSYRYTSKVDMVESSQTMLRGFNGYFGLKFGAF